MSALPPKADIGTQSWNVRVPRLFHGLIDHPLSRRLLFVWRQRFNCVDNIVRKPIGSTAMLIEAYQKEGGVKLEVTNDKTTQTVN